MQNAADRGREERRERGLNSCSQRAHAKRERGAGSANDERLKGKHNERQNSNSNLLETTKRHNNSLGNNNPALLQNTRETKSSTFSRAEMNAHSGFVL
jgi:hypothetical protein